MIHEQDHAYSLHTKFKWVNSTAQDRHTLGQHTTSHKCHNLNENLQADELMQCSERKDHNSAGSPEENSKTCPFKAC